MLSPHTNMVILWGDACVYSPYCVHLCPVSFRSFLGFKVTRFSKNNKDFFFFFFSVCISQALARTYLSHRWSLFDLKFKLSQVSCALFGDSQCDTVLGETSESISMFWGWFVHQTLPEHIPWTRPWQYSSDQGGMGTADIGAKSFSFCNVHNSNYCVVY